MFVFSARKTSKFKVFLRFFFKSHLPCVVIGVMLMTKVLGKSEVVAAEEMLGDGQAGNLSVERLASVWTDELTWLEIRDAIDSGFKTVIISSGGVEQNGPYLVTGKHNYILKATCPVIAKKLGNTLCAPVVKFVPEGSIDPPSGHMKFPGTISVEKGTYKALLYDIARSFEVHGFENIVFIGDSGGNQEGMGEVSSELNKEWKDKSANVYFVEEYYDPGWQKTMKFGEQELGVVEQHNEGYHDNFYVTATMMVADVESVRYQRRVRNGNANINGISIIPKDNIIKIGQELIEYRAELVVNKLKKKISRR